MARQILGLYWDDVQIQACLLERGMAEVVIERQACFRRELGEGGQPVQDILTELASLKEKLNLPVDTCVVALNEQELMYRQVLRPFADRRKIAATLMAELESLLPVGDDQLLYDFVLTGKDAEGLNQVQTVAARTAPIRALISGLKGLGLEPEMVTAPACAVAAALKTHFELDPVRNYIGLHLGWRETSVAVLHGEQLRYLGGLPFGFSSFKDAAQRLDQALAGGIEVEAAELKPLMRELMLKLERLNLDPETYTVVASGFKIANLPQIFDDLASLSVIEPPSLKPEADISSEAFMALGLASAALHAEAAIDLRQGELAFTRKMEQMKGWAGTLIKLGVAVLVLWIVGVVIDMAMMSHRVSELDKRLATVFTESMPQGTPRVDALKQMQQQLNKLGGGDQATDSVEPVDMLRDISAALPAELEVEISSLSIDEGSLSLSGVTASFDSVEKIRLKLATLPYIAEVKVVSANPNKLTGKIDFKLTLRRGGAA